MISGAKPLFGHRSRPAIVLVVLLLALAGCDSQSESIRLKGSIFGTGWSLIYLPEAQSLKPSDVEAAVLDAFAVVDVSMNTYAPDTPLSRFNAMPPGEVIQMGWDFAYVIAEARRIHALSDGAYDVTIGPLLDVWGFGPKGPTAYPAPEAVEAARAISGWPMIVWDSATRMLGKRAAGAEIELSSIAKGYAVDLAADVLDELGIGNFLLEVGGEMQARGLSPRGDQWRVAIERPEVARSGVARTIALSNTGIATSGDYRNYFEVAGVRYSHLIDPRTGYPIRHDLVSVTVIHPSTGIADAWATALAVMGFESAMALAEARDLPIYVIRRTGDTLAPSWSTAFNQYVPSGT